MSRTPATPSPAVLAASSLEPIVAAAAAHEGVAAWVRDVRTDTGTGHARVSEPVLPLLLAAANLGPLHGGRNGSATFEPVHARPILVVAATDADAERIAEAAGWFVGTANAAPYVSRAVQYGSGVAPSPARVGAREHARRVASANGIVVASVAALLERVPAAAARPA
ncbi:MAG: Transcription-repair-coupling factor, partial [Thermoleophilia bacterium]|nr:Transcription-repair-coupling factor [Thermoleophilia bacterium]